MYGKIYAQMFTGSMYGIGPVPIAVWAYVLANTRADHRVELNPRPLADAIGNTTAGEVQEAIDVLSSPDPGSRSQDHDGRRLIQEGQYMYFVPSHERYRNMKNAEDLREYNRIKKQESRARQREREAKAAASIPDLPEEFA
jgi:hypothetical protein